MEGYVAWVCGSFLGGQDQKLPRACTCHDEGSDRGRERERERPVSILQLPFTNPKVASNKDRKAQSDRFRKVFTCADEVFKAEPGTRGNTNSRPPFQQL